MLELIKGANLLLPFLLELCALGTLGYWGLQDRQRNDHEDSARSRRSADGCGRVGDIRVPSGVCAAARAIGLAPPGAGLRLCRSDSSGHRSSHPGSGICGDRRD